MAIVIGSISSTGDAPITVADVTDAVIEEVQNRFSNAVKLISYVDQIHRMIVRRRKWDWLLSDPQTFITRTGQTDYWIGASGSQGTGQTDTSLNLTDVYEIKNGSVLNESGWTEITKSGEGPVGSQFRNQDGSWRLGPPAQFRSDKNTPTVFSIYPAPDRGQDYLLVPEPPRVVTTSGGALSARQYFVRVSFVDALGGEGAVTDTATKVYIGASSLAKVKAPQPAISQSGSGVAYNAYNVYASTTEGSETLQNVTPKAITDDWTESVGGLTTTGATPSSVDNDIEPLGGYVMQFRYNKKLTTLSATTDELLIPARYLDIVCAGVNMLGTQFDRKQGQPGAESSGFWGNIFREGIAQMVLEQNPWPSTGMFITPDDASQTMPSLNWRTSF